MTENDFVTLLKASLLDSSSTFTAPGDGDFKRHAAHALSALSRHAGPRSIGTITALADQSNYTKPADLISLGSLIWGAKERSQYKPWDALWPGKLPAISIMNDELHLHPPPSGEQINKLGSNCDYTYIAKYVWDDDPLAPTNAIPIHLNDVLLLRAQAEAMKELSMRSAGKPVQIRRAGGTTARRDTPAALYNTLMNEFFGEIHGPESRPH